MNIENGTIINQHKIISPIGKGGMGEVFLAQDIKLNRKAAIKFLNEEFSRDSEKLNRFIQEAQATSALNHPNILTVYEISEADGKNYIATEFIEGKTLREHLSPKKTNSLNQILKIGVQVAEALSAAHQAGIIHRDIKPENIMIRADGYAKVLDFGLAKLTEKKKSDEISLEGETKALVNTNPGVVMGTVSYMSPEQARGKETDARTDIWSLGVVLYEMLAGKLPFTGETINHTIVSILEKEPKLLENVPDELQRIVRKTLTKEVEMRYQTARDLLIDLKNLRRNLDIQGELERSIVPNREITTNQVRENETQIYTEKSIEETKAEDAEKTQNVTTSSSLEYAVILAKSHKFAAAVLGIILLAVISAVAYFGFFAKSNHGQIESIAVMPFVNESGNADVEYLSDGMTETLISSLSNLPNLNVKPRSSVFRYKGKETNPQTIGKELNVQAILNGRVVQRGQDISLFVGLIDISLDKVIWSQQYNRKQSDLVTLQSDIARDVSSNLKTKLSGADEAKVTNVYTTNSEAYQLYLKGNYYTSKFSKEGFRKGDAFFEQAIKLDPNYALAYNGIAYSQLTAMDWFTEPKIAGPKARDNVAKAIALNDKLAETQLLRGMVAHWVEWDWITAESAFKKAIELNPSAPRPYGYYAWFLTNMGRNDEAIASAKQGQQLDPISPETNFYLGVALLAAGRSDEAIARFQISIELDPTYFYSYNFLGRAYLQADKKQDALAAFKRAVELEGENPENWANLAYAYGVSGNKAEAEKIVEYLKEKSKSNYVAPYYFAIAYVGLGENEETFKWLERAYDDRSDSLVLYLTADPQMQGIRSNPRFKDLLKRMNLPE